MVIRKKAHENAESEQETFYYSGNEYDENILQVSVFVEILVYTLKLKRYL